MQRKEEEQEDEGRIPEERQQDGEKESEKLRNDKLLSKSIRD